MSRAIDGTKRKDRRKKVLSQAKGYVGRRSTNNRIARAAVMKAGVYAYRDRRARKRDMRSLWIVRINAAVREYGLTYSQFMNGIHKLDIKLSRLAMSNMAIEDKKAFAALVEQVKGAV